VNVIDGKPQACQGTSHSPYQTVSLDPFLHGSPADAKALHAHITFLYVASPLFFVVGFLYTSIYLHYYTRLGGAEWSPAHWPASPLFVPHGVSQSSAHAKTQVQKYHVRMRVSDDASAVYPVKNQSGSFGMWTKESPALTAPFHKHSETTRHEV
jgi:hypothetical protein